jgi:hypothetical protein
MSSRRVGISPVKRPLRDDDDDVAVPSSPVRCPICGLDLSGTFEADRDAHADACASALSQRANDGNDTSSAHNAVAVTNADDDDDDDLIVVHDDFERVTERRAEMASSSLSARILGSETIEAWLRRIGMVKYFALYVSEDLLDVEIARECTEEDLVGIGVRKEDARVLARCGGALASSAKRHQPTAAASRHPVIVRRIAREALAAAKLRAETNAESLWDVAKGAEDPVPRGRGESLPHISRLLPKPT